MIKNSRLPDHVCQTTFAKLRLPNHVCQSTYAKPRLPIHVCQTTCAKGSHILVSHFFEQNYQCWVAKRLAKHRKWCHTYSNYSSYVYQLWRQSFTKRLATQDWHQHTSMSTIPDLILPSTLTLATLTNMAIQTTQPPWSTQLTHSLIFARQKGVDWSVKAYWSNGFN